MKSRLFGSFFLLLLSCSTVSGLGSVVSKDHWRNLNCHTSSGAEDVCIHHHHGNLATIYRESDVNIWELEHYRAWIGLYRDGDHPGANWVWSDGGKYHFTRWVKNGSSKGECAVVHYPSQKVYGVSCQNHLMFFCQTTEGQNRKYKFILESKTWSEAREYCREHYGDLASFTDSDMKTAVDRQEFPVWIGLHREGGVWKWRTGRSDVSNVKLADLGNDGDCVSISSKTKEMATQNCQNRFPSICMSENVVLIREKKTWEEALEHCRALISPTNNRLRFDLLSVQPSDGHDYLMSKILAANTEEVWTGLRFLAGEWLWVNGADMQHTDLPLCPILGHHCGALSKKGTGSLEPRGCMERKNFLCYSTKSKR